MFVNLYEQKKIYEREVFIVSVKKVIKEHQETLDRLAPVDGYEVKEPDYGSDA